MKLPFITQVFAQDVSDVVGTIENPLPSGYQSVIGDQGGITLFISNILRFVFVAAGIYALINLITAGFQYMSAGGDSKAIGVAWGKIWQSLMGLVIIVASFALASLFGYIIFGDANFILNPQIYGPN